MPNEYYSDADNERHATNKAVLDVLSESGNMICPFCGDDGFDRVGLKLHLGHCEEYDRVSVVA
jgi:hypothetical protein